MNFLSSGIRLAFIRAVALGLSATFAGLKFSKPATATEPITLPLKSNWLDSLDPAARSGYRHLTESVYLPHDLDDEVFERLVEQNSQNSAALPDGIIPTGFDATRAATFLKYGLTDRPGANDGKPLQYVVDAQQRWVMNCFACHGGSVYGQSYPGAPNNLYQLQTFTEEVRAAKLSLGKPMAHMDIGSLFMPLGNTVGTTNAVMFGVALMNYRDADLNVHTLRHAPEMVHHDMDPPPWWHFHRKQRIYIDGFAQKGVRGLMQFMLVRENGPEKFRQWEKDFKDVYAFIDSVRPPRFCGEVDQQLAQQGQKLFNKSCAQCHGTYASLNADASVNYYPERLVPIDEVNTDRVRLDALTPDHRTHYGKSWFAEYGKQDTWPDPGGYVAPPLDGIWASAPYFHNGSVPTLWHVLHPESRPQVWRREKVGMDAERIGLQVEELTEMPRELTQRQRRWYFNTRDFGKGNQGHDFANVLTESEKRAVLEYLKTL